MDLEDSVLRALESEFGGPGGKFERALRLVLTGSVKLHRFVPSGREIWTVVGKEGDHFVDGDRPYCSCDHFYFSVLGGKEADCYHILALRMARRIGNFDALDGLDEEYFRFCEMVLEDISRRWK